MSRHRFFLESGLKSIDIGDVVELPLSAADVHHALAVLRIGPGEEIDVVAPDGHVWRMAVETSTKLAVEARLLEAIAPEAPCTPEVTLVFGVAKGPRSDDIVEGAVELGVSRIVPVLTARSVVKLDGEKRVERGERLRRVAHAAAKQSKRSCVPRVDDPAPPADVLPILADHDLVLVAWEEASSDTPGVTQAIRAAGRLEADARVALVVGPEGGLTDAEASELVRAGGVIVTLGRTILRVDTAALAGSALVIHELGGLGGNR